jgi:hypothetical protein
MPWQRAATESTCLVVSILAWPTRQPKVPLLESSQRREDWTLITFGGSYGFDESFCLPCDHIQENAKLVITYLACLVDQGSKQPRVLSICIGHGALIVNTCSRTV